jgi:hypothetical protein
MVSCYSACEQQWIGAAMDGQQTVPELAGLAEIEDILGVTRQRVRELVARDDFPKPVQQLSSGPIYVKSMVEAFNQYWHRKPGRPDRYQVQVSAELVHISKAAELLSQQILRMVYNNQRLHDLSKDPLSVRGHSLYRAIQQTPPSPGYDLKYDREFFDPEPPDSRYIRLHAECCSLSKADRANGG